LLFEECSTVDEGVDDLGLSPGASASKDEDVVEDEETPNELQERDGNNRFKSERKDYESNALPTFSTIKSSSLKDVIRDSLEGGEDDDEGQTGAVQDGYHHHRNQGRRGISEPCAIEDRMDVPEQAVYPPDIGI
jgi:hypothetical protein